MGFDIRSFIEEVSQPCEGSSTTVEEQRPVQTMNTEVLEGAVVSEEQDLALQKATGEVCSVASFLQKRVKSRVERYQHLSGGLSKREKRTLEQQLLKPEAIPQFIGNRPARSAVEERTVKMIFEADEDIELFKRFFRVNNYKGQNTRDVDIIVALVEALDRGSLEYNATDKTLNFITDNGERIPL